MLGKNEDDSKKKIGVKVFLWLFVKEYLPVTSEMKLIQMTKICYWKTSVSHSPNILLWLSILRIVL